MVICSQGCTWYAVFLETLTVFVYTSTSLMLLGYHSWSNCNTWMCVDNGGRQMFYIYFGWYAEDQRRLVWPAVSRPLDQFCNTPRWVTLQSRQSQWWPFSLPSQGITGPPIWECLLYTGLIRSGKMVQESLALCRKIHQRREVAETVICCFSVLLC